MLLLHEWICTKKRTIERQTQRVERETIHSQMLDTDRSHRVDDAVSRLAHANTFENNLIEK